MWTNPNLFLYHATTDLHASSVLKKIDLSCSRPDADFGRGFYTTTSLAQAQAFAQTKQRLSLAQNVRAQPVVIMFQVSRDLLASLESLWFVRSATNADDFWNLVKSCRMKNSNRPGGKSYDVVVGPVAKTWHGKNRIAYPDYDQISFHSAHAAALLDQSQKRTL